MASDAKARAPRLPPRWVMRAFWSAHRGVCSVTGGRMGLSHPKSSGWGSARLTTIGRRTGQRSSVIIGYFVDGPNLVTLAMNGWGAEDPAWWINLQSDPDAMVDLASECRPVRARAAEGDERSRLWARWLEIDEHMDAYAALRPTETAVVILEPRITDS